MRIGCVDERGQQAPQHLLADGAFAFDELRPGRVWLEADGLDDVVWRAPRKELLLHAGERIELVWDLSDRQPALVELTLKFDGLPTGGVANPLFDGLMQGESIPFAADGKALWRTAHEGELSFQARNFDGGESLAGVARLGTSGPLGRTRRGARQQFEIAIDTALVRVVRADAGAAMTRVGAQPVRASVSMPAQGAAADGTALAGGLVMLSLSLEPTREPLGQFRAGPGRYSLSSMSREGFWECELEVAQAGAAVDAQLALTPVPER
ncbi:MAG: hypothetical protein EPO68_06910 [Planctomycetota bacterium]|nr:MAG: hypothetical protein EPO68_06910 [Planctomycetota bacterium]